MCMNRHGDETTIAWGKLNSFTFLSLFADCSVIETLKMTACPRDEADRVWMPTSSKPPSFSSWRVRWDNINSIIVNQLSINQVSAVCMMKLKGAISVQAVQLNRIAKMMQTQLLHTLFAVLFQCSSIVDSLREIQFNIEALEVLKVSILQLKWQLCIIMF